LQDTISGCLEKHCQSDTYQLVFEVDKQGDVSITAQWPLNTSPHLVTESMGKLLAAISTGTLDMNIVNAIREFGMTHDRKGVTDHILMHWHKTRDKIKRRLDNAPCVNPVEVWGPR
jgi:hypothetical protein